MTIISHLEKVEGVNSERPKKKKNQNTWFWHGNFQLSSKELLIDMVNKFQNTVIIQREETSKSTWSSGACPGGADQSWYCLDSGEVMLTSVEWIVLFWVLTLIPCCVLFFHFCFSVFHFWMDRNNVLIWLFWGIMYWFLELSLSFGDFHLGLVLWFF